MVKKYALGIIHADDSWFTGDRYNLNWLPDADYIWDLNQLQADPRPKILMVTLFNPGSAFPCQGDFSWADLILGVTSEICNYTFLNVQNSMNNKNVIFVAGGLVEDSSEPSRTYAPMMFWVSQTFENNHYVPAALPDQKPYLFDALLGSNKTHRVYVFYRLFEDGFLDRSLVSMWRLNMHEWQNLSRAESDEKFNKHFLSEPLTRDFVKKYGMLDGRINFYRSPELDQLELPEVSYPKDDPLIYTSMHPTNNTRRSRDRPNNPLYLSQEIPAGIHDASWYSIVVETLYETVFITEKTGKALLAKRVFVLFAARGSLEYLRSQGFQTFGNIIDESYDSEPNNRRRFDMAWEQVRLLSTLDPREVYQRANSIIEHNYNLLPTLRNEHLKIRDFIAQWLPR